jgi:hypothetical protein
LFLHGSEERVCDSRTCCSDYPWNEQMRQLMKDHRHQHHYTIMLLELAVMHRAELRLRVVICTLHIGIPLYQT